MSVELRVSENHFENESNQELLAVQNNKFEVIDFGEETLKSISKLGGILRRIRRRMESEGYTIKDGILIKKEI
jgi:hypothetical protein